jgi:hypothetical protein
VARETFRIDEYDRFAKWLEAGIVDGVRRGLVSAGYRLVGVIQNEIIPAEKVPPVFDGAYRAAWRVEIDDEGVVSVVNDMPYASVIERGARPENIKVGRKMIDALAEWARRKGLTGHAPSERSGPDAMAQSRQIAWAIARAMQGTPRVEGKGIFNRDGKQGLQIAKKAAKRLPEFLEGEVRREMKRG